MNETGVDRELGACGYVAPRTRSGPDALFTWDLPYNARDLPKNLREYQCLTEPLPAAKAAGAVFELFPREAGP